MSLCTFFRWLGAALGLLCVFVGPVRAQGLTPSLLVSGATWSLSLPYVEVGADSARAAYSAALDSTDLMSWRLRAGSLAPVSLVSPPSPSAPVVEATAGVPGSTSLVLPYLEYTSAVGTRAYAVRLDSVDLRDFILQPATLQDMAVNAPVATPSALTSVPVNPQTVAGRSVASSTQLGLSWVAGTGSAPHHYEATASEPVQGTQVSATGTAAPLTLTGLKASTPYTVRVRACGDAACSRASEPVSISATTPDEVWQLQGSGNTTAGLSRIVSDGNVRISATRFGPDAAASTAGRVQLYYGPSGQTSRLQALTTALTAQAADSAVPASYLSFTGSGATTGLISPTTASTAVKTIATGQGVPLSAALGAKVRLFFEAQGSDGKTRIYSLDSQDGYLGQDFNAGSASTCATAADYSAGGGCVPTLAVGVEGDASGANAKITNARQNKVGFAVLDDWRWDGAAGTFMVFTTDSVTGCATTGMNHGYAVWSGSAWVVQYASNGCPKLFKSAQAAFPMHLGGARYKLYYGDPAITTGRLSTGGLPFLGPKKLIYADGALTSVASTVDFEDWEAQSAARDVVFLWPNGEQLDDSAEGYIDDYHFLAPTGSLNLQVMYLAITNGTEMPFGAAAILLNP